MKATLSLLLILATTASFALELNCTAVGGDFDSAQITKTNEKGASYRIIFQSGLNTSINYFGFKNESNQENLRYQDPFNNWAWTDFGTAKIITKMIYPSKTTLTVEEVDGTLHTFNCKKK